MKKLIAVVVGALLAASLQVVAADAVAPKIKAGASCTAVKTAAKVKVSGKTLVCTKTAKGAKVWTVSKATLSSDSSVSDPQAATPSPVILPTPTASPTAYPIVIDPNGGGVNDPNPRTPEQAETPTNSLAPAPSGLAISAITDTSVTVTWDAIPAGALYQVYVRQADSYTSFGVDSNYSSHTFENLTPGTDYVVGIYAALPRESNIATLPIHTTGSAPVTIPALPGPTTVSATSDDTSVTASWSAISGASYYSVSITDNSVYQGGVTSYGEPSLNHTFTDLQPGVTYRLMVAGVINGVLTDISTTLIATTNTHPAPPAPLTGAQIYAPGNMQVIAVTPTSVTVTWSEDAAAGITLWNVYARLGSSFSSTGFDGADRQATLINLTPGTSYEIGVKGFDGSNWTTTATIGVILPAQ